jgi:hypothetical protein
MFGSAAGKKKWPLRVQTGGKETLFAHDLVQKPVSIPDQVEDKLFGILRYRALPGASCITMRRHARSRLSFGTRLERTAPESLAAAESDFVHYDM